MIPAFSLFSGSRITKLAEVVLTVQLNRISAHPAKAFTVKTYWVLLETFEHRERWWCHDSSITMTTVIELLLSMCRDILVVL